MRESPPEKKGTREMSVPLLQEQLRKDGVFLG
jgi:hypothetical protein